MGFQSMTGVYTFFTPTPAQRAGLQHANEMYPLH